MEHCIWGLHLGAALAHVTMFHEYLIPFPRFKTKLIKMAMFFHMRRKIIKLLIYPFLKENIPSVFLKIQQD